MAAQESPSLSENRCSSPPDPPIPGRLPLLAGFARQMYELNTCPEAQQYHDERSEPRPRSLFRKEHFFFFYGTLMDPATLMKVLHLKERPKLQPARIIGYHCKLWGPYPALLNGPYNGIVHGVVFEVESQADVKLLQAYETNRYRQACCSIQIEDRKDVEGTTFMWRECNAEELREGKFDLKDWQMNRLERDLVARPR